ncbi:MAG: phosphoglycerate kinase [Proteobacteria bacterium]|nr:phosphoglycerate kinase [Desulfobacteraceae bacterium]MBU3979968.1 phosphoglycerate kinase [Pseudomonadota bacterium]MBU4012547.1 phosphoglycerate kinase [Pseudomonadota bacterium]MBU4068335.1 phosphoglycerate kinase [Pseudomonadota bacterium]MBU4099992.1 phosphoglycerate kinase [Pseudomonadota bacterium]
MRSIKNTAISGKKVLIRVDFNVPMDEQQNITDDTRIRAVLPTLKYALDHNAILIIASHLGRPKGKVLPELSLAPVAKRLARLIEKKVIMATDCIGPDVEKIVSNMKPGEILLLENLRFHNEEQKNDDGFAEKLAKLCDVYVNDAFAVSHRSNASVVAITKYAPLSVAGFLLQKELDYFKKAMADPKRPLVAIIGGSKVSSKLGALENMLKHVDKFIIGGAMANTFLKSKGYSVGKSKIEENLIDVAGSIIKKAAENGIKFYLPVDAKVASQFNSKAEVKIVPIQEIPSEWMVLDIGPATSLLYSEALQDAKTIIWNGPMGVFEMDAFSRGTIDMVNSVAESYAMTIVGGGDTDVAVHKAGKSDMITYISTGGGAFLTLLEGKPLPAVVALNNT